MTGDGLLPTIALGLGMALAGCAFGLFYFTALRRTIFVLAERRGWVVPITLTLGRVAAAIVFLMLAARLGAISLLAAFLGFLLARVVAIRREGRSS